MPESCTNGVDDDQNGLTDCADPACADGFVCADIAPSGWNGPVILYDGDPAALPTCPDDHPTAAYQGHGGLIATPAVCEACTCSAPAVSCSPATLGIFDDNACANQVAFAVQPAPGQCGPIAPPAGVKAVSAGPATPTAGACTPGGGAKTLPPPTWQRAGLACVGGGLGGGCSGKLCTGKPLPPFEPGLCVWHSGDLTCPAAFPQKHAFVDSVNDTRDCTGCSCGAPDATCAVVTHVHSQSSCNGAQTDVPNDGSCAPISGNLSSIDVTVTPSASCAPAGGAPVGTVAEGSLRTTVCCAM